MTEIDLPRTDVAPSSAREGQGGPPAVVALGGGHGLAASLRALRRLTPNLTAVVTVADNGGSSGRIRRQFGGLPPGDLRMALAALCGDDDWGATWSSVSQHRFGGEGDLAGHAVGNVLLAALWEITGDPVAGLDWMGRLLQTHGRVLPMSEQPLEIVASVRGPDGVREVAGQEAVATCADEILDVRLHPDPPQACPAAVAALRQADIAVLGPGSWYTSLLPHLLVPDLAAAVVSGPQRRIVVLNLVGQPGETAGFDPPRHLDVLAEHVPGLRVDHVLADSSAKPWETGLRNSAAALGADVRFEDVSDPRQTGHHDPVRLAGALANMGVRGNIGAWR